MERTQQEDDKPFRLSPLWVSTGYAISQAFHGKMLPMDEFLDQRLYLKRRKRKQALRLGAPVAIVAALLAVMVSAIYFSVEQEREQNTNKLIADTLWARQNIQFQIEGVSKSIEGLAQSNLRRGAVRFNEAVAQVYRSSDELAVLLQGPNLTILPRAFQADSVLEAKLVEQVRKLSSELLVKGVSGFVGPFSVSGNAFMASIYPGNQPSQMLVAVFNLQLILDKQLPWWFVQNNEVELLSPSGATLAMLNKGAVGRGEYTHVATLDLLGLPFRLRVNSALEGPALFSYGTSGVMLLLVVLLLISFGLLWRDSKKRLQMEALLESEKLFRQSMQDSMAVGMRVWDLQGRIRYVNPAFCKIVGYTSSELVGVPQPLPYWPEGHAEEYQRLVAWIISGNAPREGFETIYQHKNGNQIHVLVVEAPLRDSTQKHVGWMSSVLDITDRKKSERLIARQREELQAASRFALVGEVASNIAHELNQPLATMVSFAQAGVNLSQRGTKIERYAELFGKLRDQAQRASRVVGSVQNLVRKRQPVREWVTLQSLEDALKPELQLLASSNQVMLDLNLSKQTLSGVSLFVDRIMVEQAVVNLVKNATEAFGIEQSERLVSVSAHVEEDDFKLVVRDNGPGFSITDSEKMFQALVSTKPNGLGLGLSLCRSVAEAHAGRLTVAEIETGGTEFSLSLPSAVNHIKSGEMSSV